MSQEVVKALSLWQPWASLWLSPRKTHETRGWPISHRGWMIVHAAARKPDEPCGDPLDTICEKQFGRYWPRDLPRMAIIGMVNLTDCIPTEKMPAGHYATDDYVCGDFSEGRYAFARDRFITFDEPIRYSGRQRQFNIPLSILPMKARAVLRPISDHMPGDGNNLEALTKEQHEERHRNSQTVSNT